MADILLSTLNSKYIHSSFALRYLQANLQNLQNQAEIIEFTIHQRPADIVEKLFALDPKIIGFSVYIWNVEEISECVKLIKLLRPQIQVVLGGPEVSHIPDQPSVVDCADYVIKGPGELQFKTLCEQLLNQQKPLEKVIAGIEVPLESLQMPYHLYTDEDIKNRIIYVEASRGCPFKCEFCLSSLDKTSKSFSIQGFLAEMQKLMDRGARHFKFIDRTFNLKTSTTLAILNFFLEHLSEDLSIHFEVIPDRLPDPLKQVLSQFPEHVLQFEIGVQTFDPEIQSLISRRQNNEKTRENIQWLRQNTKAHIHADLIFGLPGDNLWNFGKSFDQLVALNPQEIQLGILKRLRGAPINRHTEEYQMIYSQSPPYSVISTRDIDFETLQRVNRMARFWDMIGNSGRFPQTRILILGDSPFTHFLKLSDSLFERAESTWKISLRRLFKLIYQILIEDFAMSTAEVMAAMEHDFQHCGEKGRLTKLLGMEKQQKSGQRNKRQKSHEA